MNPKRAAVLWVAGRLVGFAIVLAPWTLGVVAVVAAGLGVSESAASTLLRKAEAALVDAALGRE